MNEPRMEAVLSITMPDGVEQTFHMVSTEPVQAKKKRRVRKFQPERVTGLPDEFRKIQTDMTRKPTPEDFDRLIPEMKETRKVLSTLFKNGVTFRSMRQVITGSGYWNPKWGKVASSSGLCNICAGRVWAGPGDMRWSFGCIDPDKLRVIRKALAPLARAFTTTA